MNTNREFVHSACAHEIVQSNVGYWHQRIWQERQHHLLLFGWSSTEIWTDTVLLPQSPAHCTSVRDERVPFNTADTILNEYK